MTEGLVYVPPEYLPSGPKPAIFLAGPIQGAVDWQSEAIKLIQEIDPNITITSPRRQVFDEKFNYDEQVDWETHHLRRAGGNGVIMFWLARESEPIPGRASAQTSRFELAEWKVKHERDRVKMVIGIESGFSGAKYIRKRFGQDCPEVPILDNLEDTCLKAAQIITNDQNQTN